MSSQSNNIHTVPVEIHQVPDKHPDSHHSESDEKVQPNPRTAQKRNVESLNKVRQNGETSVSRADNNTDHSVDCAAKDEGISLKNQESINKSGVGTADMTSPPDDEDTEVLRVQSRNSADLTKSRTQNVNRVTKEVKRRRHRQKRDVVSNAGRQEPDLLDREAEQTTDNKTIEYSEAAENSPRDQIHISNSMKSKISVGRSVSITSQKSTTGSDILENSMTSIDVNRMSIPILRDTFDDDTMDTPRSTGGMTPRSDSETYNSLPRVIKVKKSKSMEQMKRNLRRSIKRSRHRIEGVPGMYIRVSYASETNLCTT
jgi:hypothetical protein